MARTTPPKSTALAKRVDQQLEKLSAQVSRLRSATKVQIMPAEPLARALESRTLTDVAQLGELGYHPLTLTPEQEAVLAEPVDPLKVLVLPSGAVYYPHTEYTRWFNRGFGRAAWVIVPAAKPTLSPIAGSKAMLVTQVFVLFVHGKPVAQATGEGQYHESNKEQTHADVVEALNASALRRMAKRLGIGLELWDRAWGRTWQAAHAVKVSIKDESRPQWRRKGDAPLKGETGLCGSGRAPVGDQGRPRGAREPQATDGKTITQGTKEKPGQVERLWAIMKASGLDKAELKGYLRIRHGVESTSDITRGAYEGIIADIQRPGPLLDVVAPEVDEGRTPGEEG